MISYFKNNIKHYKSLLLIAFPLIMTNAGQMILQLADNTMVGHFGKEELAAASLVNSIFVVIMMFGMGIIFALTPLISKKMGAKDFSNIPIYMKNGFAISIFLSIIICAFSLICSQLIQYLGQPEHIVKIAIPYFQILSISLIPLIIFYFFKQTGEGLRNTFWAMVTTWCSIIINIVLNYVLIFGKFGFPSLGLIGAGWATLISRMVTPFLIIFIFQKFPDFVKFQSKAIRANISIKTIKEIISFGIPISLQMVLELIAFAGSAIMIGWIGDTELAAHQVALGLSSFIYMIANALSMATTIKVSTSLGTKDFYAIKKYKSVSIHLTTLLMVITAICFYTFRYQLASLFTLEKDVIELASKLLIVASIYLVTDGIQVVKLGILRGIHDVNAPMIYSLISYIFIGISTGYIMGFVFNYGIYGIWFGFVTGLISAMLLFSFRIKRWFRKIEG
jgi:MATE family multidrug resistance protein